MKFLKRLLLTFFLLIVVATMALWTLSKTIKPETVKQFVNSQLTAITHKSSQIKGIIAWQLFPRPGVKITQIEVGHPNESEDYSFTIDNLLLNLKITPLLRGHLVFTDININGLNLLANQSEISHSDSRAPKERPQEKAEATVNQAEKFAIERLMLTNGQITLRQKNSNLRLQNIQLGIEQFNLQKTSFPVQLKAKVLAESDANKLNTQLNFKGRLKLSPDILQSDNEAMKDVSANGQLLLQNLAFNQIKIDKLNANLKKEKNELILNPLTLSLYHGEAIGDLRYQLDKTLLTINQTATNLDGKHLLQNLSGKDVLTGSMDYSFHLSIPLHSPIDKWSGNGSLTVKDGEFKGINLSQLIDQLIEKIDALMDRKKLSLESSLALAQFDMNQVSQGSTPFKLGRIQYHLAGGNLTTDSLILQTDRLQVKGSGSYNLQQHHIDSKLQATVTGSDENNRVYRIQNFLGGAFPISISGQLEQPQILPDLKMINRSLSHNLIKQVLDKPVKDIEKQLKSLFR